MTTDPIGNAAKAVRMARRGEGVTVSQLASECKISRASAHSILVRLIATDDLRRDGNCGRLGHIYRYSR